MLGPPDPVGPYSPTQRGSNLRVGRGTKAHSPPRHISKTVLSTVHAGSLDAVRLVQVGPHMDRAQASQPAGQVVILETTAAARADGGPGQAGRQGQDIGQSLSDVDAADRIRQAQDADRAAHDPDGALGETGRPGPVRRWPVSPSTLQLVPAVGLTVPLWPRR